MIDHKLRLCAYAAELRGWGTNAPWLANVHRCTHRSWFHTHDLKPKKSGSRGFGQREAKEGCDGGSLCYEEYLCTLCKVQSASAPTPSGVLKSVPCTMPTPFSINGRGLTIVHRSGYGAMANGKVFRHHISESCVRTMEKPWKLEDSIVGNKHGRGPGGYALIFVFSSRLHDQGIPNGTKVP